MVQIQSHLATHYLQGPPPAVPAPRKPSDDTQTKEYFDKLAAEALVCDRGYQAVFIRFQSSLRPCQAARKQKAKLVQV